MNFNEIIPCMTFETSDDLIVKKLKIKNSVRAEKQKYRN